MNMIQLEARQLTLAAWLRHYRQRSVSDRDVWDRITLQWPCMSQKDKQGLFLRCRGTKYIHDIFLKDRSLITMKTPNQRLRRFK